MSSLFTPRVRILRRGRVYVFGRDNKADFTLPSDVVSRRHAEIQWSPQGAFEIRDNDSKNGTRVNDVPVLSAQLLKDGDRLSIGPFTIQYREYQGDISGLLEESKNLDATTALPREALLQAAKHGTAAVGAFAGKFAGHELLEICRLIGLGEKDGVLTIKGGETAGQIAFERGEMRHVLAGALAGEPAAYALLRLPAGRFEFTAGKFRGEPNCSIRTDGITMEAARRLDEQKTPAPPDASDPSTPGAGTEVDLPPDPLGQKRKGG